jgi:RimJ/RimL family protein N-acetyltransferase
MILHTPRLVLRAWRDDDAEAFAAMMADPRVTEYLRPLADRAACDAWVAKARAELAQKGYGRLVVEAPGVAAFIGVVGLLDVPFTAHFTPAVEIAWRLGPGFWGKGYASEAARAVLDDGFVRLGRAEIVAITVPANRRSQRVMQRLGMTRDPGEDFDHPLLAEGDPLRRHVLYRASRPETAAPKATAAETTAPGARR